MGDMRSQCPYVHNEKCNRGCRGFQCRHREENRKVEEKPLTVGIPGGLTPTGRVDTSTKEWQE